MAAQGKTARSARRNLQLSRMRNAYGSLACLVRRSHLWQPKGRQFGIGRHGFNSDPWLAPDNRSLRWNLNDKQGGVFQTQPRNNRAISPKQADPSGCCAFPDFLISATITETPSAQLDGVHDFGSKGCRFEPCRVHALSRGTYIKKTRDGQAELGHFLDTLKRLRMPKYALYPLKSRAF
jgi:hypothetical protein